MQTINQVSVVSTVTIWLFVIWCIPVLVCGNPSSRGFMLNMLAYSRTDFLRGKLTVECLYQSDKKFREICSGLAQDETFLVIWLFYISLQAPLGLYYWESIVFKLVLAALNYGNNLHQHFSSLFIWTHLLECSQSRVEGTEN